jgi:glycosyltransferase involved in cell wall biosynthesis
MRGIKGVLARCGERLTMACSTRVFSISNNMMEQYIAAGFVKRDKIKVLLNGSSNGFDVDYFSKTSVSKEIIDAAYKECGLEEGQFVFCTVGGIVHDKGIDELVSAFKRILADYENVQLLLVGSYEDALDPIRVETKKEIESNPNIHNVGWKNDVRPYMIVSDVLVHPSHREGFGNVIAQACLLDTPCIVTDICGPNEIITEGVNGTIYPPKDENALYLKMKHFVDNKEEIRKLGSNARKSITSRFSRTAIWEALLSEYKSLEKQS